MRSDYYYAPVQNTPQPMQGQNPQMNDMSGTVHAAFGNASQKLQAQPMNMAAATQEAAPAPSKKELKKQEKEVRKAAKKAKGRDARQMQPEPMMQQDPMMAPQQNVQPQMSPQQQVPQQMQQVPPQQPTMVQSSIEEPDVNVDMIDL